jgi:alkanesulfonate monooxygenase SsuD/methylene tetrahydromethanopterin reductase-like flavin-dependent oxidoreductase (luciferase family)
MPIMARLGIGLLIIPQKPWEVVRKDFDVYHQVWHDVNGDQPPPAPLCGGTCFVDRSADQAEELAHRWMGAQYESVLRHYEFASAPHEGVKGYEFYTGIAKYIGRHGTSGAVNDYVNLMPYGTPEQVLEKLENIRGMVGLAGFTPGFSYGGMPYDEAERSMRLFVEEVMPELESWHTEAMARISGPG